MTTTTNAVDVERADTGEPTIPVEPADVVDELLGVRPGDRLDQIRAARPEARANAQRAYEALFQPVNESDVSRSERLAVATFVVGLHGDDALHAFYAARLAAADGGAEILDALEQETARAVGTGPYGVYREPGLSAENVPGPVYRVEERSALLGRLAAALEHAHLLVLRPREATPEALDHLLEQGWSTTGVVTLSQLVAFLAFQVRIVHGLRQLALIETEGAR